MNKQELQQNFIEKPEVRGCRGCWFFENDQLEECFELTRFCHGIIYKQRPIKQPNYGTTNTNQIQAKRPNQAMAGSSPNTQRSLGSYLKSISLFKKVVRSNG